MGEATCSQIAPHDLPAPKPEDETQGKRGVKGHPGGVRRLQALGFKIGMAQRLHLRLVFPLLVRLRRKCLHHIDAHQVFLQDGRRLPHQLLDIQPHDTQFPENQRGFQNDERDADEAEQSQFPVQNHQDGRDGDQPDQDIERAHEALVDELPDRLDISRGLGHEVAGMLRIVEREAQVLQFVVEQIAKIERHLLRQGVGGISARKIPQPPHEAHPDERQGHEGEGGGLHV